MPATPSHYRHRRSSNSVTTFPNPLEPGEIAVNTANRQIAVGDASAASIGVPKDLLGVRIFDVTAAYAAGDYAVQGGGLYKAKAAIPAGAFSAAQWDLLSTDVVIKAYADAGDASVTAAFTAADNSINSAYQAADATLTTSVNGKVSKAGDVMTGALNLPLAAPTANTNAANKKYVDDMVATMGGAGIAASAVTNTPSGNIAAVDVQTALNELDAEKAPIANPTFTGDPKAPTPATTDNDTSIATTAFVKAQGYATLAGPIFTGAVQINGTLTISGTLNQYAATAAIRNPVGGADVEFGHVNPAGYGSVLGHDLGSGAPWLGFNIGPGTTQNTYKTLGIRGAVVKADMNGGFGWFTVPLVSGDNQNLTALMALTNGGDLTGGPIATSAVYLGNINAAKILTSGAVWTAAAHNVQTVSGTITLDFATGINFHLTITAINATLANPTNAKTGQTGTITIYNGVGGTTISTWGSKWKFAGGVKPTPSAAGGAFDMMSYVVQTSGDLYCTYQNGFA